MRERRSANYLQTAFFRKNEMWRGKKTKQRQKPMMRITAHHIAKCQLLRPVEQTA